MIKLFSSDDRFAVQQVVQVLDEHAIPYVVKNEFASGAIGELSPLDVSPEVWLLQSEWFARAELLINELKPEALDGSDWVCSNCNEQNTAAFAICWQCGKSRE